MVNLGAALLDVANREKDPDIYSPMYSEVQKLMKSALQLNPGDKSAELNLKVAKSNLLNRRQAEGGKSANLPSKPDRRSSKRPKPSDDDDLGSESSSQADDGLIDLDEYAEPPIPYDSALQQAMRGHTDAAVLDALRREHARGARAGHPPERRALVAANFGVALLQSANELDNRDLAELTARYAEGEDALEESLALDPSNANTAANLALVRRNRELRGEYRLFNPHVTPLGPGAGCARVLLRRLQLGQLSATLFTCEGRPDAGLLWMYEAEALRPPEWARSLREGLPSRRTLAYDARVRRRAAGLAPRGVAGPGRRWATRAGRRSGRSGPGALVRPVKEGVGGGRQGWDVCR